MTSLRQRVLKLAFEREDLRPHLFPLLQRTGAEHPDRLPEGTAILYRRQPYELVRQEDFWSTVTGSKERRQHIRPIGGRGSVIETVLAMDPRYGGVLKGKRAAKDIHIALKELPQSLQRALKSVGYRRKDVRVVPATTYSPSEASAGFEGSRGFIVVVNMLTGQMKTETGSWGGASFERHKVEHDRKSYPIPNNGAVIVGESGGRGTFARIKVHPNNLAAMLPAGSDQELSEQENLALNIIGGLKGSYRAESFRRNDLGPYKLDLNPLLQSLVKKKLLQANRAGAMRITTLGRNVMKRVSVY